MYRQGRSKKNSQQFIQEFQRTPRGIFIVAGGPMVGKNTIVQEVIKKSNLNNRDLDRDELRGFNVEYDDIKNIGIDQVFTDAYRERIAQEAWRIKTTDEGHLDTFAAHLGFNTKSLEWDVIEKAGSLEELTTRINRLMDSQATSPFKEMKF